MEGSRGYSKLFPLIEADERRRLRPYAARYLKGCIDDFPRDSKGRSKIRADILDVSCYCFKRVNEKRLCGR